MNGITAAVGQFVYAEGVPGACPDLSTCGGFGSESKSGTTRSQSSSAFGLAHSLSAEISALNRAYACWAVGECSYQSRICSVSVATRSMSVPPGCPTDGGDR